MVRRRRSLITAVAELWRSVATLASSCSSVERRGVSRVQLFGKERRGAGRRLTEQGEKEVEADSNLTKSSELQRPDIAQRRRWRERKVAHSCGWYSVWKKGRGEGSLGQPFCGWDDIERGKKRRARGGGGGWGVGGRGGWSDGVMCAQVGGQWWTMHGRTGAAPMFSIHVWAKEKRGREKREEWG
jgi:hypothetical protein